MQPECRRQRPHAAKAAPLQVEDALVARALRRSVLFTNALGLVPPWEVAKVELDTAQRRIDFEVRYSASTLACPRCGAADQRIHDRLRRSWRHLDLFQFEAWLHADVPRVACKGCGKTSQAGVPWAREGSDLPALFEALALAPCRDLPVRQAAALLRCGDKQLWTRIAHVVGQARAIDDIRGVFSVGIDDTACIVASAISQRGQGLYRLPRVISSNAIRRSAPTARWVDTAE